MIGGVRTRMLWGVLVLVVVAWSLDGLLPKPEPKSAKAAVAAELPEGGEIAAAEMAGVLAALETVPRERPPLQIGTQDLFSPPAPPEPAVAVTSQPVARETTPRVGEGCPAAGWCGDCQANHEPAVAAEAPALPDLQLEAILFGRQPTALISGRVRTRGQRIGDYRVRKIDAEHVILEGPGGVLRLDLPRPGLSAGNN